MKTPINERTPLVKRRPLDTSGPRLARVPLYRVPCVILEGVRSLTFMVEIVAIALPMATMRAASKKVATAMAQSIYPASEQSVTYGHVVANPSATRTMMPERNPPYV